MTATYHGRDPSPADLALGQRAFGAYRDRLVTLLPGMPTWSDLTPIQHVAWCDAARAARRTP